MKIKVLTIGLILLGLFAAYIQGYQQVVNQGFALEDERCLTLDPILDKKREAISSIYNSIKKAEAPDEVDFATPFNKLRESYKETPKISGPLLAKYKKYAESWQVKVFASRSVQENIKAAYNKYKADHDSNILMLKLYSEPDNESLKSKVNKSIKNMDEMQKVRDQKQKIVNESFDFRSYFIRAPVLKCTDPKPQIIPNV